MLCLFCPVAPEIVVINLGYTMKNTKKALIFAALATVVVFCFIAGCTDTRNVSDENLYIIHTNDVHGYFANYL